MAVKESRKFSGFVIYSSTFYRELSLKNTLLSSKKGEKWDGRL